MPAQRDVIPLGGICAEATARLLVNVIKVSSELKREDEQNKKSDAIDKNKDNASATPNYEVPVIEENKPIPPPPPINSSPPYVQSINEGNKENLKTNGTNECQISQKENQEIEENSSQIMEDNDDKFEENVNKSDENESKEDNDDKEKEIPVCKVKDLLNTEIKQEISCSQQRLKEFETYRKDLVEFLTSHSHVALHDKIFSSFVSQITEIYMTNKKTRSNTQEIVPYFINSSLRELVFEGTKMFSETAMCQVIVDHLENACHLGVLDIGRSCYWRQNVFENLSSKLRFLPELTVLRIQYIGTPSMIAGLAESCPNLLELNLKGSENITDNECPEIAKCLSLKYLDITGTRITGKGCWTIVHAIKSLSWLMHCAFNCNSDALLFESRAQLFDLIKEQVNTVNLSNEHTESIETPKLKNVFNLKNFWLFNPRTEDMFSIQLCPQLEHLRLDFIFQDIVEVPDVEVLSQIPKLNKLHLNLYDRNSVDLVTLMIEGCGSKLTTLDLLLADDYFYAAQVHNVVARCCPNLVTLRFAGDYKVRRSLEDSDNCLDFEIPSPAHPRLENLRITGVVSDCRLRFMLSHAPAVRHLHFDGELEWLHDETFENVMNLNPLPHLEYVWFNVSTTITLKTVRYLLEQENAIHTIGRLCHMAEASTTKYQELQDFVCEKNLNVKLIWVTGELNR